MANPYERVRPLGEGSFGRCYLVRHVDTGEELVAKEITIHTKGEHDEAMGEAQVLSSVKHINIIRYKEVRRVSPQKVTIITEFADDADIDTKIQRRRGRKLFFQSSVVLQWTVQLAQALEYLHARGIIHRDVKTANCFLTRAGVVKLGDFGVAKLMERNAPSIGARTTRTPVGTPMYVCPQVCAGKPYTQKADIWGLGCCVYEMCTLEPAFIAKSMDALMNKIAKGQYGGELPDHFTDDIHDLIPELLRVDPEKRPAIKDVLALPVFDAWLPTSPATLVAQGLAPKSTHPWSTP